MEVLRHAKNLNELQQQFGAIKSGCAGDTNFMAAALLWLCEHRNRRELVTEMRALRRDLMARRKVEETMADRIGVLESATALKDLAAELRAATSRRE